MDQQSGQPPQHGASGENASKPMYAGFLIRVAASTIDSILLLFLITPLLIGTDSMDLILSGKTAGGLSTFLITWVMPAVVVIVFWVFRAATPGKMILRIKIVDARTCGNPTPGKLIWRYFAYFFSTIPLMLGLLWVAFDKQKQGWHDKLAGTIVMKT